MLIVFHLSGKPVYSEGQRSRSCRTRGSLHHDLDPDVVVRTAVEPAAPLSLVCSLVLRGNVRPSRGTVDDGQPRQAYRGIGWPLRWLTT